MFNTYCMALKIIRMSPSSAKVCSAPELGAALAPKQESPSANGRLRLVRPRLGALQVGKGLYCASVQLCCIGQK
eukprot:jgi/Botrbrau1/8858/Bobra.50_2s0015.1